MPTIGCVKVKSVKPVGTADVYNMEVDKHHNFSINGGIIVHNCYDGLTYGLCAYHAKKSKSLKPEKSELEKDKERLWKACKRQNRRFM
jgi:hypothetical protein